MYDFFFIIITFKREITFFLEIYLFKSLDKSYFNFSYM
jgi:hypothetical protein